MAHEQFSFSREEEKVLAYWSDIDAFRTSLRLSEGRPIFSFFDGPPFATGLPHYGHLLAGTMKDVVTRYQHATGHYVERRFGWDCHGLPIEFEIDKTLGIRSRSDVLEMGIDKYNAECKAIVMRYSGEWRSTINRLGRWIDFDNDYKTLNIGFMESVWWVFKTLYEKDQVYRGYRVMPFSTGCKTPLANFEATLNYKDVSDPSVVVAFTIVDDPDTTSLIAWTTTPWTLPSNLALCVHPEFDYVKIKDHESGRYFILLEKRLDSLYKDVAKAKYSVVSHMTGAQLADTRYVPLFNYFENTYAPRGAFRVLTDTYVTDDSGTGIVHQAPAFGEDDYRICLAAGIITNDTTTPAPCPIDDSGIFIQPCTDLVGQYFKDTDKVIQKTLKQNGQLIRQATAVHSYPFCWRSDTPLMYRAVPSWFVRVANIRDRLTANNHTAYWVPDFVKEKRFHNWLANAKDWNVSRSRFWGTPMPLWASSDYEEILCIGSVEELERLSGAKGITDLHRDKIDHITIPSQRNPSGPPLRRVEEVFDCWFESGAMPYAQQHYPFENKEKFASSFPADFIAEGIDQTRGWFYTLLVLGTHLFDVCPFKNIIVNGLVLAADGRKMSKSLKNYPDPIHVLNQYGADALRLFLINSLVVRGDNLEFKEEGVKEVVSKVLLPWYNAFKFLSQQITLLHEVYGVKFEYNPSLLGKCVETTIDTIDNSAMDRWIVASCHSLIAFVRQEMDAYRLYTVVPRLLKFINDLTNMYVRYNRRRLKCGDGVQEGVSAVNNLFGVLLTTCKCMAPFTPFLTEHMYQTLLKQYMPVEMREGEETASIHFLPFPDISTGSADEVLERQVARMQSVIDLGRACRDKKLISLKIPLMELVVIHQDETFRADVRSLERYILDELNVRKLTLTADEEAHNVMYRAEADFRTLAPKLRNDMPKVKAALETLTSNQVKTYATERRIVVAGVTLEGDDLKVVRYFAGAAGTWGPASDKEVLVLLDTQRHPELEDEGMAREVINRVQRLRKKAGLKPTDTVDYLYTITEDVSQQLARILESQQSFIHKTLQRSMAVNKESLTQIVDGHVAQEEQEINGSRFVLWLVTPKMV